MYQVCQGGFNLKGKAWGLGWGLGSVFNLNKRWQINSEAVVMHINEDIKWNPILNLNSQLKAGFEYKLDKDFSLYLGPTANFMVSRYKDHESGVIGSSVPMYSIVDYTNRFETNFRFWVGLQTGMRMRLW
jgi:long-subunit fatty acid transport protein